MSSEINRFKWARVKIKRETLDEAAEVSQLSRSLIVALEKETDKPRKAGYENIKKLAVHYGVSMDWLCGILPFENWSIDKDARAVEQYTGLSSSSIRYLNLLAQKRERLKNDSVPHTLTFLADRAIAAYDFFIANKDAKDILYFLYNYLTTDFNMAYRQAGESPFGNLELHPVTPEDKKAFFPSKEIRFLIDAEYDDWTGEYFYNMSENDFAETQLIKVMDQIRRLRQKVKEGMD